MYKAREQADILKELQELSNTTVSKVEGTFENDVFASNSIEFYKTEIELEQLYNMAFADTSAGEYLTMRAAEAGVIRKLAVKAVGTVTVSGTGDLPRGSLFATETGQLFETTESIYVNKTADVPVQAVTAGIEGNVLAGEISVVTVSIPGIMKVTNKDALHGGYDEETDEALLARYLLHVRTPGTTGNAMHYLEWALSVPGVGSAKVIPTWAGPNTVKVIIVDANRGTAGEELIKAVSDYIETVRPIGASVTVVSAKNKAINIACKIVGAIDKGVFEDAIREYLKNITTPYVSIAKVADILFHSTGVEDYSNLTLNGDTSNATLAADELPKLGTVSIT